VFARSTEPCASTSNAGHAAFSKPNTNSELIRLPHKAGYRTF
jgi:hypothetical protein